MIIDTDLGALPQECVKYLIEQKVLTLQYGLNGARIKDGRFDRPVYLFACFRGVVGLYAGSLVDRVRGMLKDKRAIEREGLEILWESKKARGGGRSKAEDFDFGF